MAIAGVIFDLDGVLIDSAAAHLESWRVIAERRGKVITDATFLATFGRSNADIIPLLFPEETRSEGRQRIADDKEEAYRALVRGRLPVIPGAVELIRACRAAGLKTAIGSSAPPENVALALEEMGVADSVMAVVTGDDVTRGKPDPEVFLKAAAHLQLAPERCVVIEDAPAGIEAAKRAKMGVIAVGTTHPVAELGAANCVRSSVANVSVELIRTLPGPTGA
jgi:beta-phosphoglucomutase